MKVVIVGGGFGGVHTALKLANKKGFEVKLLSGQSYFEYHAALYRSATGRSPLEVAIPLKDFFAYAKNIEVVSDKVTALDAEQHLITGETGAHYPYDALVLALGNVDKVIELPTRQFEVLLLASLGQSLEETAAIQYVSHPTVKKQRSIVLNKFGALNMAHAVRRAYRYSTLTLDSD